MVFTVYVNTRDVAVDVVLVDGGIGVVEDGPCVRLVCSQSMP